METFLDILVAHPKVRFGTNGTFVKWNADEGYFEALQEGVQLWSMTFAPDTDPHDIERDLAQKLWQVIG